MVDTAAFHSNKTTIHDYTWIKYLCKKYKFDYQELVNISIAPTDISNIKKASLNGLKIYNINDKKIASSYIHISNPQENEAQINNMCLYLQEYTTTKDYNTFAFIVHDITTFKTTLYKINATDIKAIYYDEYTDRGKTIIPEIVKNNQKKKTISTQ